MAPLAPDAETAAALAGPLNGVWWLRDNTVLLHAMAMYQFAGEGTAVVCARDNTTRAATWLGLAKHALAALVYSRATAREGGWVQTDSHVDVLGLTAEKATLWIRPTDDPDELRRLSYDAAGRVDYQYRLVRVARWTGDGGLERTRHHAAFARAHAGVRHFLAARPPRARVPP
jgi:hypothetical protein